MIEVIGSDLKRAAPVAQLIERVIEDEGREAWVVTGMWAPDILASRGISQLPAVCVVDCVVWQGSAPPVAEIKRWLERAPRVQPPRAPMRDPAPTEPPAPAPTLRQQLQRARISGGSDFFEMDDSFLERLEAEEPAPSVNPGAPTQRNERIVKSTSGQRYIVRRAAAARNEQRADASHIETTAAATADRVLSETRPNILLSLGGALVVFLLAGWKPIVGLFAFGIYALVAVLSVVQVLVAIGAGIGSEAVVQADPEASKRRADSWIWVATAGRAIEALVLGVCTFLLARLFGFI